MVTLAQIARRCRLSVAAVSKALSEQPDISPRTRERVKRVASRMGYVPNLAARTLATRRTMAIGVLTAFPQIPTVIERIRGIQDAANAAGYATAVAFHDGRADQAQAQLRLFAGRVDGLVLTLPRPSPALLDSLRRLDLPVVLLSEPWPRPHADYVGGDDRDGGRMAVRHLLERGHRRFAYLGQAADTPSDRALLAGMRAALRAARVQPGALRTLWNNLEQATTEANVDRLLATADRPTAIVACSDMAAIWTMHRLRTRGVVVPKDIAVIGFDNTELAAITAVPLTSVGQPSIEIGRQAGALLIERLRPAAAPTARRRIVFPSQLVVRESSGGQT
jgi:LacI family transcriptional regulator